MRSARRITGRRSAPVRPMDWEFASITIGAAGGAARVGAQVVTSTELNAQYTDPTLMASRMVSAVSFASGAGVLPYAVIGLIAWDDINDTVPPLGEIPGPISNGNLDWIMRQVHFGGTTVATVSTIQPGDETITSRARRRLGSSRTILAVLEVGPIATTATVIDVRCLIKE